MKLIDCCVVYDAGNTLWSLNDRRHTSKDAKPKGLFLSMASSHSLPRPRAFKLTDHYVGCAPTDSLRLVSIYISPHFPTQALESDLSLQDGPSRFLFEPIYVFSASVPAKQISHSGSRAVGVGVM